jgi:hypothetical protein
MNVYEVTITRPWDGRETVSIHMTRKGALQVACIEGLDVLSSIDGFEDGASEWIEENLGTLENTDHTLTIKELDAIFNKCEELLWSIETEIEVLEYALKP